METELVAGLQKLLGGMNSLESIADPDQAES